MSVFGPLVSGEATRLRAVVEDFYTADYMLRGMPLEARLHWLPVVDEPHELWATPTCVIGPIDGLYHWEQVTVDTRMPPSEMLVHIDHGIEAFRQRVLDTLTPSAGTRAINDPKDNA